ncbi:dihydrofolate reductase family protein [Streptomyces brasiliensis]|uniref:Bacterial bifunctional deaminase-reductase C-terminal domain-containing protein n=1 Tax=Streptomyces brasiliensis TaxID=1954 RepID=A0A917KW61_9ACTN|nr:dihydrofolate reductase family protein [Streptomyces brasiliensis]GGJ27799.1 hypothetical protein GCM10010121_043900 [Streptomyces brasiliensis]
MPSHSVITSLDGCTADPEGRFDWAEPDEEELAAINDLEREIGTYLYGRRMYETMVFRETASVEEHSPAVRDFARIWSSADKVVHSSTLEVVSSARTRIERRFAPDAVRTLKEHADVSVGGPTLAGQAAKAGLVDEYHLFVVPVPSVEAHRSSRKGFVFGLRQSTSTDSTAACRICAIGRRGDLGWSGHGCVIRRGDDDGPGQADHRDRRPSPGLGVTVEGLTADEAEGRLRRRGPSAVRSQRARGLLVLRRQVRSPMLGNAAGPRRGRVDHLDLRHRRGPGRARPGRYPYRRGRPPPARRAARFSVSHLRTPARR